MKVGIALYSVRQEMAVNPLKTLKDVGELGYKYIEGANYNLDSDHFLGFGVKPKEFKKFLDDQGMRLINCHIGRMDSTLPGRPGVYNEAPMVFDLKDDDIHNCALANLEAGNNRLTIPIMFYPNSVEGIMKRVEYLAHLTDLAKKDGIELVYHPHWQEYVKIDNKFILDYVLENTDLKLEIDTFWAMRAGENPIDMIRRFADKIVFVHQKDFSKTTKSPVNIFHWFGMDMKYGIASNRHPTNREFFLADLPDTFTEIGNGTMPIQEIINAVNECTDAEYIILEQDHSSLGDNMLSAKISMDNFKKYTGISV